MQYGVQFHPPRGRKSRRILTALLCTRGPSARVLYLVELTSVSGRPRRTPGIGELTGIGELRRRTKRVVPRSRSSIGPGARERAIRYVDRKYGAFDEIEL